jgi:hypothetical protein
LSIISCGKSGLNSEIPDVKALTLNPAGHEGLVEGHQEANLAATDFLYSLPKLNGR